MSNNCFDEHDFASLAGYLLGSVVQSCCSSAASAEDVSFSTTAVGTVLVHCAQGVSRSAAVLVGYLMHHTRISYTEALAKAQQARSVVNPNEGFVLQLRKFERLNCNPSLWSGWDQQKLERSLREGSVSGRRAVQGLSDMIRRFHVHDVNDDDSTVFCDTMVML